MVIQELRVRTMSRSTTIRTVVINGLRFLVKQQGFKMA
jgi:hypothetical protein